MTYFLYLIYRCKTVGFYVLLWLSVCCSALPLFYDILSCLSFINSWGKLYCICCRLRRGPSWPWWYCCWIYKTMQSVPAVSSNHTHGEMLSIQHYAIKFVNDLRQVANCYIIFISGYSDRMGRGTLIVIWRTSYSPAL